LSNLKVGLDIVELGSDSVSRRRIISAGATVRRAAASETRELADRTALRQLLVPHSGFDLPEAERLRVPAVTEWS
jgi:hypothetical protein